MGELGSTSARHSTTRVSLIMILTLSQSPEVRGGARFTGGTVGLLSRSCLDTTMYSGAALRCRGALGAAGLHRPASTERRAARLFLDVALACSYSKPSSRRNRVGVMSLDRSR